MPTTQPNLGYGKPTEATIDQVNQWMRSTPWWNDLMQQWGIDPRNVHLKDWQKQQILKQAQANGVVVDEGNMEVDPSGNFNPIGHKLRNTLIVAGIAGATIATMGAAGAFSGAGGTGLSAGATGVSSSLPGAMATLPAATATGLGTTAAATGALAPAIGTGGTSSMLSGYLKGLMPNGGDILKGVGGYLQGRAQGKTEAQNRADQLLMNQQRREDEMRQSIANFLTGQGAQRLNATQMDPYKQAKSLNAANVRRSFAEGWTTKGGSPGNFDMSALSPENLSAENAKFQSTANDTQLQDDIMKYLGQMGGPNTKVCYDQNDGHQIPCAPAAPIGPGGGGMAPGENNGKGV